MSGSVTDVPEILARIALIEREILDPVSGANIIAYDNVPYVISAADMPLMVNMVGPLISNTLMGSDEEAREFEEVRNYRLLLFHSPIGSGIEEEKTGLLTPFFQLVINKFQSYPHLKQLAGIRNSVITGDTGTTPMMFLGQSYFGMAFTLAVVNRTRRILSEYE